MTMPTITASVRRGPERGSILEPHPYPGGKYVVSKTRFERDYLYVSKHEIPDYVRRGYSVRMSDPISHRSPRLISPGSITIA
jgi:hypothetical protein